MDSTDGIPEDAPRIRLCQIKQRSDFNGYGFNLHAEKSKPGQFIGTVDEGSPAERGGLKEGDRIVEVNDVNICHENHKQVVARIKAIENETRLLVVDKEADNYYRNKEVVIRRDLPTVLWISSDPDDHLSHISSARPNNNNYTVEDQRRNKKKLGNVCHQSFVVEEDEEDGADENNYAMQRSDSNYGHFDDMNDGSPPPLPDSAPPISSEDDERIKHDQTDRNSLGGSSYDKDKELDRENDDLPPPPPYEETTLGHEERDDATTQITVTATIESGGEESDDQQEEKIVPQSDNISISVASTQPEQPETGEAIPSILTVDVDVVEEDKLIANVPVMDNVDKCADNLDDSVEKTIDEAYENAIVDSRKSSNCSESVPESISTPLEQPPLVDDTNEDRDTEGDEVEKESVKSTHSVDIKLECNEIATPGEAIDIEKLELDIKTTDIGLVEEGEPISNALSREEVVDDNTTQDDETQISKVTETIISEDNVVIEVTKGSVQSSLDNVEGTLGSDSNVATPPMPTPRTVTPLSEKSSTASIEESSPRSFSPSSLEHMSPVAAISTDSIDVADGSSKFDKQRNLGGSKTWDGLNLNMTAREMRQRIGSKKKKDPRKEDRMDFKTKYEMVQAL